ncbi:hypothetical protein AmDm5_2105 [Acetobacter malorum]|nr:hypothetical protein AmDm5_2105 [Acetobacter malorum]
MEFSCPASLPYHIGPKRKPPYNRHSLFTDQAATRRRKETKAMAAQF